MKTNPDTLILGLFGLSYYIFVILHLFSAIYEDCSIDKGWGQTNLDILILDFFICMWYFYNSNIYLICWCTLLKLKSYLFLYSRIFFILTNKLTWKHFYEVIVIVVLALFCWDVARHFGTNHRAKWSKPKQSQISFENCSIGHKQGYI